MRYIVCRRRLNSINICNIYETKKITLGLVDHWDHQTPSKGYNSPSGKFEWQRISKWTPTLSITDFKTETKPKDNIAVINSHQCVNFSVVQLCTMSTVTSRQGTTSFVYCQLDSKTSVAGDFRPQCTSVNSTLLLLECAREHTHNRYRYRSCNCKKFGCKYEEHGLFAKM